MRRQQGEFQGSAVTCVTFARRAKVLRNLRDAHGIEQANMTVDSVEWLEADGLGGVRVRHERLHPLAPVSRPLARRDDTADRPRHAGQWAGGLDR
jgi:hypothetical protein